LAPGNRTLAFEYWLPDQGSNLAYTANRISNNVSAYAIDPNTGALTAIGTIGVAASPNAVAVHPSGTFVYVSSHSFVSAFAVNASTGALTLIDTPVSAPATSFSHIAVAPSGKFVHRSNRGFSTVSAFEVNPTTGALTPIAGSPFVTGDQPMNIATVQVSP
jgi:6-phosphogluconolactonase